jgi:hypothetical protein
MLFLFTCHHFFRLTNRQNTSTSLLCGIHRAFDASSVKHDILDLLATIYGVEGRRTHERFSVVVSKRDLANGRLVKDGKNKRHEGLFVCF